MKWDNKRQLDIIHCSSIKSAAPIYFRKTIFDKCHIHVIGKRCKSMMLPYLYALVAVIAVTFNLAVVSAGPVLLKNDIPYTTMDRGGNVQYTTISPQNTTTGVSLQNAHAELSPSSSTGLRNLKASTKTWAPWALAATGYGLNGVQAYYNYKNRNLRRKAEDALKAVKNHRCSQQDAELRQAQEYISRLEKKPSMEFQPDGFRRRSYSPTQPRYELPHKRGPSYDEDAHNRNRPQSRPISPTYQK